MYLIQMLLPLYDNDGKPFPTALYSEVRAEMVERFGGLTAYARAPASGLWQEDQGQTVRDDLVIYEVQSPRLDRIWWQDYRTTLEKRFEQDALMVRAHRIHIL